LKDVRHTRNARAGKHQDEGGQPGTCHTSDPKAWGRPPIGVDVWCTASYFPFTFLVKVSIGRAGSVMI
jgi:hypothetical protein